MKKEKKWQRFGRLNQKKIDEYLQNTNPLYEISYLFPYLPTRSTDMSNTQAIRTFKTMCDKYKFCYKLNNDVYAKIRQFYGRAKGAEHKNVFEFEDVVQIDNKIYVFTNINYRDLDDSDFEVQYINDSIYLRFHPTLEDDFLGIEFEELLIENRLKIKAVLQDMKDNKTSARELVDLERICNAMSAIPVRFEEIPKEIGIKKLKESTFYNFRMRFLLIEHDFYNTSYDMYNKQDLNKKTKKKVEDNYSIIKKAAVDNSKIKHRLRELLHLVDAFGINSIAAKENAAFLHESFLGNGFFEFLRKESDYYFNILDNYSFLEKPYSKKYKDLFHKHKKPLGSKFKTQQVFRKYKREYKDIDNKCDKHLDFNLWIMENEIENLVDKIYQSDLGDNGLPNDGLHYDGIDQTEYDEDDILSILKGEKKWKAKQERMQMAEEQAEAKHGNNYDPDKEARELEQMEAFEIQRLVNENKPLELFKFNEEKYFEYHELISIKDVVEIKQLDVFEDLSVEGKFFNYQEIIDWITENLTPYWQEKEREIEQGKLRKKEYEYYMEQGNEEKYFEYYESIYIKDVVEIKQLDIFKDLSIEGKFFNYQEVTDWIKENLVPYWLSEAGEIEQERLRSEEYEYFMEQINEEKIQRLIHENKPLELFKFNKEKYFEHYGSISINDAAEASEWLVGEGASLEGNFFSLQEMYNWTRTNVVPF